MVRIIAPDGATRRFGDVIFTDGVAETDDIAVIEYCRGAGYTIEVDGQQPGAVEQATGGGLAAVDPPADDVPRRRTRGPKSE